MSIANLSNLLHIFSGGEPDPAERHRVVKEVLLMTLARASSSDTNIKPVEVSTVQRIVKEATGEDVSEADVRVAAHSELFETRKLNDCLAHMSSKLSSADRALVAQSLAKVILSDVNVSTMEADFFNGVANALKLTPAEIAGLIPERA